MKVNFKLIFIKCSTISMSPSACRSFLVLVGMIQINCIHLALPYSLKWSRTDSSSFLTFLCMFVPQFSFHLIPDTCNGIEIQALWNPLRTADVVLHLSFHHYFGSVTLGIVVPINIHYNQVGEQTVPCSPPAFRHLLTVEWEAFTSCSIRSL